MLLRWSTAKAKTDGLLRRGPLFLYSEQLLESLLVEADDDVVIYRDDRHAHLSGLLYHFLALREVRGDIVLRVRDLVLREEILRRMAEVASRRRVDCYIVSHTKLVISCQL